jgi:hypothetical protein
MDVRPCGDSPLAGWVSDTVTFVEQTSDWNTILVINMEIEQRPAAVCTPISIEVENHSSVIRSYDDARRSGDRPFFRQHTPRNT